MSRLWKSELKMDAATEGAAGGGGSLLTGNPSGGGAAAAAGGANNQSGAGEGNQSAGNGAASGNPAGNTAGDWRSALPVEFREDPSLKTINDIGTLAKNYIHAQKMVGADKVVVPGKHATPDDWKQVYTKLGQPADIKDYQVKFDESLSLDKKFVEDFKKNAYENGILPHQAQKLADWFQATNKASETEYDKQVQAKQAADLKALESEWGAAYKQNLGKAGQALREINDPDLVKYLDTTGLGNDPRVIKMFAKIADKYMKEGAVAGEADGGRVFNPVQAMQEANKIMADLGHPYHVKDHPNHRAAVDEVRSLFEMASRK